MRVAILTQHFEPEPNLRMHALVRGLRAAGHQAEVLTALPHWPHSHYFDGYRRTAVMEEERLGVRVVRTYTWPYHGPSTRKRIANFASFALSALALGIHRLARPDVLYVYHPPLTVSLPAFVASRLRRVPMLYDVQDLWPEAGIAARVLRRGPAYRLLQAWEGTAYRSADHVTVIADDFVDAVTRRGVPRERISVIPNWADESIYVPASGAGVRREYGLPEHAFVVTYAGNFGSTHGADVVLEAARLLADRTDIAFAFAGSGAEYQRTEEACRALGLRNAYFLGFIPSPRMPAFLAASNLMVVHLRRSPSGAASLPHRMMSFMACARPILVAAEGAPRTLVETTRCGAACEPQNPRAIADAVARLAAQPRERLEELGANGHAAYHAGFSEQVLLPRLVRLVEQVAAHGRKAAPSPPATG